MIYKLYISPEAKDDMLAIKDHISVKLCNHQAAIKLVSKIMERIKSLAEQPRIGAPLSSVVDINSSYRFLVCHNYLIFYKLEDKVVYISRIIYSKRDYMIVLFGHIEE